MYAGYKEKMDKVDLVTGEGSKDKFTHRQYAIYRDLVLGDGTFGIVCKGYDSIMKRFIAAKEIRHVSTEYSQIEVDILKSLTDHDNIVRIYDTFFHDNSRYIIMQFCDGPTLDVFMEKENPPLPVKLQIIFQIIETMQFMHFAKTPTAHRDLKPLNIIMVHGCHIKLCDFGLAKFIDTEKSYRVSTFAGTLKYLAPEIHQCSKYNPFLADVFSAGLVFLAIATFQPGEKIDHFFFSVTGVGYDMHHVNQNILQKKLDRLHYPCAQTMALIKLIARMVKFTPEQRPDFNEVFQSFVCTVKEARDLSHTKCIFVLGGPGSGKSTQCSKIVAKYGFTHLSTGDLLRNEVKSGSDGAKDLEAIMERGDLVPLDTVLRLLKKAMLATAGISSGFLIDGYPRELEQGVMFAKRVAPVHAVVYFQASDETMMERVLKRGRTSGRVDDNEETIKRRLATFHNLTQPVIDHYAGQGKAHTIKAEGTINEVFAQVVAFLDKK